jgi:hypothetical protein
MSESWDARKKRVLKVREGFPESLREIPLRYVEDVAGLSQDALRALDRAYRDEPVNIPRAIQYIREHLVLSIEDLREFARPEKPGPKRRGADTEAFKPSSSQPKEILNFYPDERDTKTLAKLLMACYPSMPEISAGAMAASEVMREALKVVTATREAIESSHAQSDFVILSLFQLFSQSKNLVLEIIRSNPAFQQALEQSRIALD